MDSQVRNLWGRDFDLVEKGLSEAQVVGFVNELVGRRSNPDKEQAPSASLATLVERMVAEADKLAAEIKDVARAEAENIREAAQADAAQIEAAARQEGELLMEVAKDKLRGEIVVMKDACLKLIPELESLANELPSPKASSLPEVSLPPEPEPVEASASDPTQPPASPEAQGEDTAYYKGDVHLIVAPSATDYQLMWLQGGLQETADVEVIRTSGSPAEGTTIHLFVEKPLRLTHILKGMDCVKSCVEEIAGGQKEKRRRKQGIFRQRSEHAPERRLLIALEGSRADPPPAPPVTRTRGRRQGVGSPSG